MHICAACFKPDRHDIAVLKQQYDELLKYHPAITHCDNCGFDWLDNGLNPVGCPYCKLSAETEALRAEGILPPAQQEALEKDHETHENTTMRCW